MRYSVKSRDQIFIKRYGFFSFTNNMGKIIGKNKSKNLSGKCSQKHLYHINKNATNKKNIQKYSIICT